MEASQREKSNSTVHRPGWRARWRRPLGEALNLALASLALPVAFLLRFEAIPSPVYRTMLWEALPWAVAIKFLVFRGFALRDVAWRDLGFEDLLRVASANVTASLLLTAVLVTTEGSGFPRSIYILDGLLSIAVLALVRAGARVWLRPRGRASGKLRRVLIYGAGQAGRRVLGEVRAHPEMGIEVAGLIDDDPGKRHMRIGGTRVWGTGGDLATVARRLAAEEVWLATPAAAGSEIAAILENCHAARVTAKRIPPLSELIGSQVLVGQLREVRIEDLLGRAPVRLGAEATGASHDNSSPNRRRALQGKVVLVTGAGGSIGSELCRQIARSGPQALIGIDHSENALYQIEQELAEQFAGLEFHAEIASIQNAGRLEEIFARYRPQLLYHAAAYKHVPMMEAQMFEAIENNVFGSGKLARAALAAGVESFVLISSDKAVRPANVMGASKRLAEMVCLGCGGRESRFMAVRFGNVLGSSGSVIPRFRRQIAAGGPLTVTHPDMQRYFMTIPEAVELVLHAAELGTGGEVFILDMGEPVKILDLARKMVLLSGLRPGEDIQIEFSGIRPGEKLSEELHLEGEDTLETPHPKIRVYRGRSADFAELRGLSELRSAVAARDVAATLLCLKEMIPDYNPSATLLRQALTESAVSARGKAVGA